MTTTPITHATDVLLFRLARFETIRVAAPEPTAHIMSKDEIELVPGAGGTGTSDAARAASCDDALDLSGNGVDRLPNRCTRCAGVVDHGAEVK